MKKIMKTKNILQKIIILLAIVTICNIVVPIRSEAGWLDNVAGAMTNSVGKLVRALGDTIISLLQDNLLPGSPTAIQYKSIEDAYKEQVGNKDIIEEVLKNGYTIADVLGGEYDENMPNERDQYIAKVRKDLGITKGISWDAVRRKEIISLIVYTPRAIFGNIVPAFDVNFLSPKVVAKNYDIKYTYDIDTEEECLKTKMELNVTDNSANPTDEDLKINTAYQLKGIVASWYKSLRNIAIVVSLSVLVYIAIRILLSVSAGETAKYKTMLKDWVVGLCLIVCLHYIMAFALNLVEEIVNGLSSVTVSEIGGDVDFFVNEVRTDAEYAVFTEGENAGRYDYMAQLGYSLVYTLMVIYTLLFSWRYLKRFIYLAFLTIIAPLVAATYAIDKAKGGEAQSFNKWLKEYMFNLAIQPFHLLMYTILVSTAASLFKTNMLYAIAVIAFMFEIEKLMEQFFGLNKASGGTFSSAVTGGAAFGAAMGLTNKLMKKLPEGKGKNKDDKVNYNDRTADGGTSSDIGDVWNGGGKGLLGNGNSNSGNRNSNSGNGNGNSNSSNSNGNGNNNSNSGSNGNRKSNSNNTGNNSSSRMRLFNTFRNNNASQTSSANAGNNATRKKSIKKGVKNATGKYWRPTVKGVGKGALKAARYGAIGLGAATAGSIGLAMGLASDKPSDALKYAAMGVGSGALATRKIAGTAGRVGAGTYRGTKGLATKSRDAFEQAYYGQYAYEQRKNARLDKQWEKDQKVQEYYKKKYGIDDYKDKMSQAKQLRKMGITDQDMIDNAIDLADKNNGLSMQEAGAIMKFKQDISKQTMLNNPDDVKQRLLDMKLSDQDASQILDLLKQTYGLK